MKYLLVGIGAAIAVIVLVFFKVSTAMDGSFCAYTGNPTFVAQCYPPAIYFGLWAVSAGCLIIGGLLFFRKQ